MGPAVDHPFGHVPYTPPPITLRFQPAAIIVYVAFSALITIVMLNILIAVMADSFTIVKEHAKSEWLLVCVPRKGYRVHGYREQGLLGLVSGV